MIWANKQLLICCGVAPGPKFLGKQGRTSIHSLTAMCRSALRGKTADCRWKQPAVSASLRSVQGAAPLARLAYAAYPARPRKGDTRWRVCPPSEGLTTEHRHSDRSPGTPRRTAIFLPIFQPKVGNTFYMARRRQEETHTQRWDRDMDWRGTSHFLPWMVK